MHLQNWEIPPVMLHVLPTNESLWVFGSEDVLSNTNAVLMVI